MRRFCGEKSRGFTLVEMMVAIVVFLIFIGAIYGVYQAARASAEGTQQREDLYQTARVLLTQINTELCSAYQPAAAKTSTLQGVATDGGTDAPSADTLTFLTTAHTPSSSETTAGDMCQVTYRLENAANGESPGLYMEESFYPGLEVTDAPHTPVKLSDHVVGFHIQYFAVSGDDWQDDWVDQQTLPAAVRVELTLKSDEKNAKPIVVTATANLAMAGQTTPTDTAPSTPAPSTPGAVTTPPTGGTSNAP